MFSDTLKVPIAAGRLAALATEAERRGMTVRALAEEKLANAPIPRRVEKPAKKKGAAR